MATNRLPAATRKFYETTNLNLECGTRAQAACGSTLTLANKNMPSILEKLYRRIDWLIQLIVIVTIPVAVYFHSYHTARNNSEATIRQEYIRIATGILSQPNTEEKEEDQEAIRSWATDVLSRYSPVELSEEQKKNLISGKSILAKYTDWNYGEGSYGTGSWDGDTPIKK